MELQRIRNFSIIAHIDHGKSTLADGLMSLTQAIQERDKKSQFLDSMDIERERGITIKAQTVCLNYTHTDSQMYQLNLIDTPGHVDFSYEVSRSLSACEGALLVVDASQGVEAQTLAHAHLAIENNLKLIPVLNKVDLASARVEEIKQQLCDLIGFNENEILEVSAKNQTGLEGVLSEVVERIPAPESSEVSELRALVFDSWFDSYQGVVSLCRVKDGNISKGDSIVFMGTNLECEVLKMGIFSPYPLEKKDLKTGEVGFIISGVKDIKQIRVGDTITQKGLPAQKPLKGFKKVKPMVYSGVYPVDADDFANLKKSLEKLSLNDSALTFEIDSSPALGFGFRCGFLGLLHLEIVQERLEREFNLNLIVTAPSVVYHVHLTSGEKQEVENPSHLPDFSKIERIEEPMIRLTIHAPSEFIGGVFKLCEQGRGEQVRMEYSTADRVIIEYNIPLAEVVTDFHDQLKSISKGYASMEYEWFGYKEAKLVLLDILLNGEKIDALSTIIHKDKSEYKGRQVVKKLKEIIPRKQFPIALQAAIGGRVLARETISAFRKDVTAKLYGGDVTRKRKLLEKQKKGKKRMKEVGQVSIPQEAFMAVLKNS